MKHNGEFSDSFPIENGVKQGCVLAPTLFAVFFSMMLREAKEDLHEGVYIRFRTDGSVFNLRRVLSRTKTLEQLILDLLFADDCALLAHTEEALQRVVNRFAKAAKAFGLTISLKKTEVRFQKPPREAYTPPFITIDGYQLNAVEHFTYLGSVIANDATTTKDVDNRIAKASSSFGRLQKRVWQNHSLRLSTRIQASLQGCSPHHPSLRGRNLGPLQKATQTVGTLPPEVPEIHHGHHVAGLHHQRRGPGESRHHQR